MPTSDELLELAGRCAEKLDIDGKVRFIPSFSDIEDQCEDEYEALLEAIHEESLRAGLREAIDGMNRGVVAYTGVV